MSDMTIVKLVASARCCASNACGLWGGRGAPGWAKVLMELLAIHIGNENPGTLPFREFTAGLSLEIVEVCARQATPVSGPTIAQAQ